jgi:predicted dehydrogenase
MSMRPQSSIAPVLCEKPPATNLAEAAAMIEATSRQHVRFGVIFPRRFWPAAQRLHAAIEAGRLGRLILGDCVVKWWRSADYYQLDPWRGKWDSEGGGVLINQAIHAIDQFPREASSAPAFPAPRLRR